MTTPVARPASIRSITRDDIVALQQLDERAHGEPWSHRTFVDEIERADRVHLVSAVDDVLVGHAAAWVDGSCCRITNVAVHEDHAGQGYASALLAALLVEVLEGAAVANMQLEVRPSNRRAQRLYGRFGFVPVGIDRNFYNRRDGLGSADALIMAVTDVCSAQWRSRLQELVKLSEEAAA